MQLPTRPLPQHITDHSPFVALSPPPYQVLFRSQPHPTRRYVEAWTRRNVREQVPDRPGPARRSRDELRGQHRREEPLRRCCRRCATSLLPCAPPDNTTSLFPFRPLPHPAPPPYHCGRHAVRVFVVSDAACRTISVGHPNLTTAEQTVPVAVAIGSPDAISTAAAATAASFFRTGLMAWILLPPRC